MVSWFSTMNLRKMRSRSLRLTKPDFFHAAAATFALAMTART
jgi:hypothetical protein